MLYLVCVTVFNIFFNEGPGLKKVYKYIKYPNNEVIKMIFFSDIPNGFHHNDTLCSVIWKDANFIRIVFLAFFEKSIFL